MPNKNPYDQYKETQVNTANQGKLIVMLYDGAIKFLNIAVDNLGTPKTYDIANTNIIKAQDIITELLLSLNMTEGGEIAKNLFDLYMFFKKQLLDANIAKNADIIKPVISNLTELRGAWDQISGNEAKTDKMNMGGKGSFSVEG